MAIKLNLETGTEEKVELTTEEQNIQILVRDRNRLFDELGAIQAWLRSNDWIPNKIVTGEWETTDPRWAEYLSERQIKRNRQDEIDLLLNPEE